MIKLFIIATAVLCISCFSSKETPVENTTVQNDMITLETRVVNTSEECKEAKLKYHVVQFINNQPIRNFYLDSTHTFYNQFSREQINSIMRIIVTPDYKIGADSISNGKYVGFISYRSKSDTFDIKIVPDKHVHVIQYNKCKKVVGNRL